MLEWDENPENKDIQGYRIYKIIGEQRTLLTETNSAAFNHMIRNADRDKQYRLAITAFDQEETEGEAAYLTIE